MQIWMEVGTEMSGSSREGEGRESCGRGYTERQLKLSDIWRVV